MGPLGDTVARVAIVGFGRSEAHRAGYLLSAVQPELSVDVLEAPPRTREDLRRRYDAVLYATADPVDPPPPVPGADLLGSVTADLAVDWLTGAAPHDRLDLSCRRVVIIGDGGQALQLAGRVARAESAALQEIVVLCPGGPEQAAFDAGDVRALADAAPRADLVADARELAVPPALRERAPTDETHRRLTVLRECAARPRTEGRRRIALRFLLSPTRILGHGRVQAIELVRMTVERDPTGRLQPRPTAARATIPAGVVISAAAEPTASLPLTDVVTDAHGRVTDTAGRATGEYVISGPTVETVRTVLHDIAAGRLGVPA